MSRLFGIGREGFVFHQATSCSGTFFERVQPFLGDWLDRWLGRLWVALTLFNGGIHLRTEAARRGLVARRLARLQRWNEAAGGNRPGDRFQPQPDYCG